MVQIFYPRTMARRWAVWHGERRPHTLWLAIHDAREMAARLATLAPDRSAYQPFPWEPAGAVVSPLRVVRVQREVDHG